MFLLDEFLDGAASTAAACTNTPGVADPGLAAEPVAPQPLAQTALDGFESPAVDVSAAARLRSSAERRALSGRKLKAKKGIEGPAAPPADLSVNQFAGPDELAEALGVLAAAQEISLDLETTALTPWAIAEAPGVATKLGNGLTVRAYAQQYACTFDCTPRPRIVSLLAVAARRSWAFDLELLSASEKIDLVSALDGKIWVGHNLAFDLMWLRSIVPSVTPCALVDTMLLATTHAPDFEYAVRDLLGSVVTPEWLREGRQRGGWGLPDVLQPGCVATQHMRAMLAQRDARNRSSADDPSRTLPLDFLSVALLGEKLDKAFQKPHNWMPSVLTTGHFDYCLGDISQPPKLARILLGVGADAPISALLRAIAEQPGASAYDTLTRGAICLTRMQRNGIRIDLEATHKYVAQHVAAATDALDRLLIELPDLEPHRATLLAPDKGLTDDVKDAFARGLTRLTGIAPERTETGSPRLDAKALKMRYRDLPALAHYNGLTGALKRASMASAYIAQVDEDERLHPLVSITTVTGRTASQEPNLQNAPRGQDFRALFAAPAGKKIVAVDYTAIEMRIAAALTVRAYRQFRAMLGAAFCGNKAAYAEQVEVLGMHWFLGDVGRPNRDGSLPAIDALVYLLRYGDDHPDAVTQPGERPQLVGATIENWRDFYAGLLYDVVRQMREAGAFRHDASADRLALADVFARGLDPHIITALSTESAAGRFDLQGQAPTDFLAGLSKEKAAALKKQLAGPRQAAKAQNFGLLYGMQGLKLHAYGITNYGLDWALDEAEFAAQAWFRLYPEVRLWHLMTRGVQRKLFVNTDEASKLFRATTLTGRPVCSDKLPSVLNYQDQGTGAEIALAAIVSLPEHLAACLVNFVHDELVFEVPADRAAEYTAEIERAMIAASDVVLEPFGVPTTAEAAVGDFWVH